MFVYTTYIVHSLDVHACLHVVHCSMPVWGFDTSGPGMHMLMHVCKFTLTKK